MSFSPLVDHRRLDLITGGDPSLRRELAELFVREAARYLAELERALGASDHVALGRAAHAFRGASANFGAVRLGEAALAIETAAEGKSTGSEVLVVEASRVFDLTRAELQGS